MQKEYFNKVAEYGQLIVVSGPSGVGKKTVIKEYLKDHPNAIRCTSITTRPQRPDEVEGVDYYFVSKEDFETMISEDAFLEYDAHMDNYYGTPEAQLEEKLCTCSVILDVEPVGAFHVREKRPDATLIFIAPPSMEELERRLRTRGDTSEAQMKLRLERAIWEMEQAKKYDYTVINDQVETCSNKILQIIADKCGEE